MKNRKHLELKKVNISIALKHYSKENHHVSYTEPLLSLLNSTDSKNVVNYVITI